MLRYQSVSLPVSVSVPVSSTAVAIFVTHLPCFPLSLPPRSIVSHHNMVSNTNHPVRSSQARITGIQEYYNLACFLGLVRKTKLITSLRFLTLFAFSTTLPERSGCRTAADSALFLFYIAQLEKSILSSRGFRSYCALYSV